MSAYSELSRQYQDFAKSKHRRSIKTSANFWEAVVDIATFHGMDPAIWLKAACDGYYTKCNQVIPVYMLKSTKALEYVNLSGYKDTYEKPVPEQEHQIKCLFGF